MSFVLKQSLQVKPGFYYIRSKLSNKQLELYLDIADKKGVEGSQLQINDFDGGVSQQWYWENGYLYNVATFAKPLVVDVAREKGPELILYTKKTSGNLANQVFEWDGSHIGTFVQPWRFTFC